MREKNVDFSELVGKKIISVERERYHGDYDYAGYLAEEIIFGISDGSEYKMFHEQDCCESVTVKEVDNDLQKLVGATVLVAECVKNDQQEADDGDTFTWTFYKLVTDRADYFTISWMGESNGYYSESVDFVLVEEIGQ